MAFCIWITGMTGSGKSTLAGQLVSILSKKCGILCSVVDGDALRAAHHHDLGFSPDDVQKNVDRAAKMARDMMDRGENVIVALISPIQRDRNQACVMLNPCRIIHTFASLAVLKARDPKGLYARFENGEVSNLSGVDAPYEAPKYGLWLDTGMMCPTCTAMMVLEDLWLAELISDRDFQALMT